ncbi:hypothetical protein FHS18_003257 [Paenibacillus phyllosphaerae]|uniref:Uncharacterized protein n=1 Tax=Paenibacillus phyllosphaerae TaxID=274593 RepID=A0A7W5AZ84_9BACL|nr:CBO0543 family protein [Paenibacillus phyllosphaerae]MBB3111189.1 hypothetical protein [Paenibacillus phyllosphaerae]
MDIEQSRQLEMLQDAHQQGTAFTQQYWHAFSGTDTWQFWLLLGLLVVPLLVLFMFIDRKQAILVGFFGLNIHVWASYCDHFGVTHGYWNYPYKLMPFFPESVPLDTALVPITYMFIYQWTLNSNRNFYAYALTVCALFAFVVRPTMVAFDLFVMFNDTNFVVLFMIQVIVLLVSKLITSIFLNLRHSASGIELDEIRFRWTDKRKAR